ncbi:RraA family protein [Comamonas antarctica]|uniref:RraA family protein n=1 Tax=Comamonas antarctica TaxID=2743470 RepID=UPI0028ECD901|nr:RraA family protein [Comamonas antarctica]
MTDTEIFAALQTIPTSHLSDNLDRMQGIAGLNRYHGSKKLVGRALTVKVRPGDNLLIYKALTLGRPGDVLVVDGHGETSNALVGELIMLYAIQRDFHGFVIDGAIRDCAAFAEAGFPCHARALNHKGPYKLGPGQINVPVNLCGQVVQPGDWVVGDEDGVVTFAPASAEQLIAKALATADKERGIKAEISNGQVYQKWLFDTLEKQHLA